jgi:CTP:molybdopterin cytidylyltransferase MocA
VAGAAVVSLRAGELRIVAILLAAGAGRRIGGCKALLRAGGRSFLELCHERLCQPGVEAVVAVTGSEGEAVARIAGGLAGLECVPNPRHADGMLGSLLVGLKRAELRGADAVLVHPVDHPLVQPATVARVVEALRVGAAIVAPSWQGRRGHPGGFHASIWPALRRASPERGAREVLALHEDLVVHVEGGPGCRLGIDTPEDFQRAWGAEPSF